MCSIQMYGSDDLNFYFLRSRVVLCDYTLAYRPSCPQYACEHSFGAGAGF